MNELRNFAAWITTYELLLYYGPAYPSSNFFAGTFRLILFQGILENLATFMPYVAEARAITSTQVQKSLDIAIDCPHCLGSLSISTSRAI